ncbi:MAG: hypothetical protein PHH00_02295 [Candidatus Nanoarchaeia archaeon]|nr:hypothetical protein [Candidatus Nanoarchaeia archaeon]
MRVTEEEAQDLRAVKSIITEDYVRNPNGEVSLVCRKTARVLEEQMRKGYDIRLDYIGRIYSYIPPEKRRAFTPEVLAELATIKLARLCYYVHHGRRRGTKEEILDGIRGHLNILHSEFGDGGLVLNEMAYIVSKHFGTPLEAVA